MQVETFLPCFPGFYGTYFEFENEGQELEYINEKRAENGLEPISYDDVKWEYQSYRETVSKKAVSYIEDRLNEMGIQCKLAFKKLQMPREYNFSTDMIIIEAEFEAEQVRKAFMELDTAVLPGFFDQFLPSSGFSPFSETMKKADVKYWMQTDFDNFHDFGLACELILTSHIESQFDMDEFVEKSTHEVEVGIENYSDLIKISVDIDKWNAKMGYSKYPETQKFFDTDPDIPQGELPYRQGDVVYMEDEKNFGVVIGCIDAHRGELRTDLAGMAAFSDIRIADCDDLEAMRKTAYGMDIISFLKNN